MGNSQSQLGQLNRAGIQRAPMQEYGVKGMRWGSHKSRAKQKSAHKKEMASRAIARTKVAKQRALLMKRGKVRMVAGVPAGWEGVLKAIRRKHPDVKNPRMVVNSLFKRGYQPGYDRKGKKIVRESLIRESRGRFLEQGQDEQQKGNRKGRVYLVTIIEEGIGNSKDKNYYSGEALKSAPQLFDGAKAYADHPDAIQEKTLPERSMRDLVGWYSDCVAEPNPQTNKVRLRGKLHFFPDAKWLTDKIDTILTDSSAQNLFGISINAIGKTRPAEINGETVNYVEQFIRVDSADVVTEPAARGKFDKMLESRRASASRRVKTQARRVREAGVLTSEKAKDLADSLISAYHSDSPDEIKEAAFGVARQLQAASSVSGKGPGQVNEEQFSNINPYGGQTEMATRKTKASRTPGVSFKKRRKKIQAAAGTGADNENLPEPSPEDIPGHMEEADVEDEESRGDLGQISDFGSKRKPQKFRASRREETEEADEGFEDEGLEDESLEDEAEAEEGFEDEMEDEDENVPMAPGAAAGAAPPPVAGGRGAPTPSMQSEADDEDEYSDEDQGDDQDAGEGIDDDLGEAEEDEHSMVPSSPVAEASRKRRARSRSQEAGFSGGLGKSGKPALPGHAIGDYDEDYSEPDDDSSTSAQGKSYKLKTSKFRRNRLARRVAKEANRRIGILEAEMSRLRESNRARSRKIERYQGILSFNNSKQSARALLREAVKDEILPDGYARTIESQLWGISRDRQIQEIKRHAYLLESTREGVAVTLRESGVEGVGARGALAFHSGTGENGRSELLQGLADDGIPMKR